jgi:hypothetical protein
MRLLRLRLRNFRGTAHREVRFATNGVTIVSGPNEAGKSSLIEAYRLALKYKDNSRAEPVRNIQPVGTDLPTEVEVELTSGEYHFVLTRRWHKETSTRLRLLAPVPEEVAGAEAHARLVQILDDTVDEGLLELLHMGQDESQLMQGTPNPWGGDLADALNQGRAEAGLRIDTTLVDLAAVERGKWLTGQGRDRKTLKAQRDAVSRAEQAVVEVRATQEELDNCVAEHDRHQLEMADLRARREALAGELEGLELRRAKLDEARRSRDLAESQAAAAAGESRLATKELVERRKVIARLAEVEGRAQALVEGLAADRQRAVELEAAAARAQEELASSQNQLEEAALEAERYGAELRRAELAQRVAEVRDSLEAEIAMAAARTAESVPVLRVRPEVAGELAIGSSRQDLQPGAEIEVAVGSDLRLSLPGAVALELILDPESRERRAQAEEAARGRAARLEESLTLAEAQLAEAGGAPERDAEEVAAACAAANHELAEARAQHAAVAAAARRAADDAAEAARVVRQAEALIEQAAAATAADRAALDEERTEVSDADLEKAASEADRLAAEAQSRLAESQATVEGLGSDSLVERVERLEAELATVDADSADLMEHMVRLAERARLLSDQGLHTRLQDAEAQRDALANELAREERKAAVADLLWKTLDHHRASAESAYRDPLRLKIEELGRKVLGETFSVEMGHDLTVAKRRLHGRSVAVEQLSAGAREQLALIGRVACASLAARDGAGAPLVLDDILGFSDPQRCNAIARLLAEEGAGCQVIVLTCDPDRYAALSGANVIHLGSVATDGAESSTAA